MEALPNPLLYKKLYSWIKSEARKSFHQRRLHDDGNLNAVASKLVFLNSIKAKKMSLHFVSKYDQPDGSIHLPMHLCFSQDEAHSTPKVQASGYLKWVMS